MFNIDKVPLKYIIGSYVDGPNFPTSEDILFLISNHFNDRNKFEEQLEFTNTQMYKLVDEQRHGILGNTLSEMVETNLLEIVKDNKNTTKYKIIKNPFI